MLEPQIIWLSEVQFDTAPQMICFDLIVPSGLEIPMRFRSPNFNSDGLAQTIGSSSGPRNRTAELLESACIKEFASQNAMPLGRIVSPPIVTFGNTPVGPVI